MNTKQREVFEQKWQESAAIFNANPSIPDGSTPFYLTEASTLAEMEVTVDKGRCERIINAVIDAGVPEIEWRIGERLVVYGFIGDARVFDLSDTMDGWLLGQDFFHSDDDKFYPTLNETKSAAEQAFRAWWLKAQGE